MPQSFQNEYDQCLDNNLSEEDYALLLKKVGLAKQRFLSNHDMYLGSLLYLFALAQETEDKKIEWLQVAAFRHHSFHAVLYLLNQQIEAIQRTDTLYLPPLETIASAFYRYFDTLQKHMTPGFILMTHCNLWLDYLQNKIEQGIATRTARDTLPCDFLHNAMLSISIAHELHSLSPAEIHNAYGDVGLRASTTFNTADTNQMVYYVYGLFGRDNKRRDYNVDHFQLSGKSFVKGFLP